MKAGIHPEYYETDIVCACGAVYHTRSTRRDIRIGICAACHPFFTGEQKFVDTAGRVEKFAKRYGSTKAARAGKKGLAVFCSRRTLSAVAFVRALIERRATDMDFDSLIQRKRERFEQLEREIADPRLFDNRKRASEIMREHASIKQLLEEMG